MKSLSGKTSLILGAIGELALGVAESLHQAGSRVIFAASESPTFHAENGVSTLEATMHTVDLDDPQMLVDQIASLQPFHIAVFSPGWYAVGEFMDTSPEDWDQAIHQNFERMIYAAQAAAKALISRGEGGRMIFLSSAAGLMPFLQTSVAGTTLTALGAVARMAAVDLGPHGITVNVVAAGWMDAAWARPYLHAEGRAFVEQGIPVGRIGEVQDVGALCCFLASDAAEYITGAIIPVDGGYTLTRAEGTSPYPPKEPYRSKDHV